MHRSRFSALILLVLFSNMSARAADETPGELFHQVPGKTTRPAPAPAEKVLVFSQLTPPEDAATLAAARKLFADTAARAKIKAHQELATDHVLIFTDTPAAAHAAIKDAAEAAFIRARQTLGLPPTEKIRNGKLILWLWAKPQTFLDAATDADNLVVTADLHSYYAPGPDGGHIASLLPPNADAHRADTQRAWTQALQRDALLAFLGRWKTSRPIPPWLARGLAETLAADEPPDLAARDAARMIAAEKPSLRPLFTHPDPAPEWFPAMETLAELLAAHDSKPLPKLLAAIKDGTPPEEALRKTTPFDFARLEHAWRKYIATPDPQP